MTGRRCCLPIANVIINKLKTTAGMEDIEDRIEVEHTLTPADIHHSVSRSERSHLRSGKPWSIHGCVQTGESSLRTERTVSGRRIGSSRSRHADGDDVRLDRGGYGGSGSACGGDDSTKRACRDERHKTSGVGSQESRRRSDGCTSGPSLRRRDLLPARKRHVQSALKNPELGLSSLRPSVCPKELQRRPSRRARTVLLSIAWQAWSFASSIIPAGGTR